MKTFSTTTFLATVIFMCASAYAQDRSYLCQFNTGPRAGSTHDYQGHPSGPLPIGSPCTDGQGSMGVIVSNRRQSLGSGERGATFGEGSCRSPSTENDCDRCSTDRGYERCLVKLEGDD